MALTSEQLSTLVLIGIAAVLAPILSDLSGRIGIPDVVIELLFGIVLGPAVLDLARPESVVNFLSDMGLAFLMFLAGFELDINRVRGRPIRLATVGWGMSVGLAVLAAFVLVSSGFAIDRLIIGLALTTTALGTLLPIMRDAGLLSTPFGRYMLAIGTVGEFGPIVAIALFLTHKDPGVTSLLLILFIAVAVAAAVLATRRQPPRLVALLQRHLNSSAQLPVRISVTLILLLVYLAYELGLDVLLGAFAAGVVVRLFSAGPDHKVVQGKLEAIGFGFLVPIFFIVSGTHFDVHALVTSSTTWLRVLLFLALFLVVRGTPALLLYRRALPHSQLIPLALFSATGLPLIVVITQIGLAEGRMRPQNAAALVAAGILSVLIFPLVGGKRLRATLGPAAPSVSGTPSTTVPPTTVPPTTVPPTTPPPTTSPPTTSPPTTLPPAPRADGDPL
jgi:Kef-type K+ transport system membrane component KefB